jgi:release factor glutamine methyltransferase
VDPDAVPWSAFLAEAERRLRDAGFESAAIEARRIVEEASGYEGAEHHLGLTEAATERGVAAFDRLLERRLAGEPLQYVLGSWGFRTLDLFVDRRVLIPRPETESVVEQALIEIDRCRAAAPDRSLTVVDLGTGSGAIALAVAAERTRLEVWATDVSTDAIEVARVNLAGTGRVATRVRLAEGSWFEALPDDLCGNVDVIVSNPPYVAATDDLPDEVRRWEPELALVSGPTGFEALDHLVEHAATWLRAPGALVVELAPSQASAVAAKALTHGFDASEVVRDLVGRDRIVVARRG